MTAYGFSIRRDAVLPVLVSAAAVLMVFEQWARMTPRLLALVAASLFALWCAFAFVRRVYERARVLPTADTGELAELVAIAGRAALVVSSCVVAFEVMAIVFALHGK